MYLFLQICFSALAVFGFYFLLKTVSGYFLASPLVCAAIVLESALDVTNIDLLLEEASLSLFAAKSRRLLIVIKNPLYLEIKDENELLPQELLEAAKEFRAEIVISA